MADPTGGGNSRLAEIRKKFQSNSATFVPTPENQFGRMKKSKKAHAKAIRVAKARAARYNMTLRSLAIKTTQDVVKIQKDDIVAKKKAAKDASRYNMTSRALPVATISFKDRQNISKALNEDVSPTVAGDVLNAVARKRHAEDVQAATVVIRKPSKGQPTHSLPEPQTEAEQPAIQKKIRKPKKMKEITPPPVAQEPTTKSEENGEEEPRGKTRVEMAEVGEALVSGNEEALNRAILKDFLNNNAPQMMPKLDLMLEQYKDQLHELFDNLLQKYPNAPDAEISGQQKADKEIADAVEEDPAILETPKKVSTKVPAPVPVAEEKPEPTPAVAESDDDDDSMVVTPENMDVLNSADHEEIRKKEEKRLAELDNAGKVIADESDDDSLVIQTDENFKKGYEEVIQSAEGGIAEVKKSLKRRTSTLRLDNELTQELKTTYGEPTPAPKLSVAASVQSDDSLVVAEEPTVMEQYIVVAELEENEDEEEEEESRWAVTFQNKNYALKQKLIKQGLSKNQVNELVDNLDTHTSGML